MKAEIIKSKVFHQLNELKDIQYQLQNLETRLAQSLAEYFSHIEAFHMYAIEDSNKHLTPNRMIKGVEIIQIYCQILDASEQPMSFDEIFSVFSRNYAHMLAVQIVDVKKYCKDLLRKACREGLVQVVQKDKDNKLYQIP